MVEIAGGVWPARVSQAAIDLGPASWPSAVNARRMSQMRVVMSSLIALGLVWGRRVRGSSASQPPCLQAATSWLTRGWEMP